MTDPEPANGPTPCPDCSDPMEGKNVDGTPFCRPCDRDYVNKMHAEAAERDRQYKLSKDFKRMEEAKEKAEKKDRPKKASGGPKVGIKEDVDPILSDQETLFGGKVPIKGRKDYHTRDYEKFMTDEDLEKAKGRLDSVKERYGFVPVSIFPYWYSEKDLELTKIINDRMAKGSYGDNKGDNEWVPDSDYSGEFQGLSQFPPRVSKFTAMKWGVKGGNMIDPFGGRMSIPIMAHNVGMNMECYELWPMAFKHNKQNLISRTTQAQSLGLSGNEIITDEEKVVVVQHQGRTMACYNQNSLDMCYTMDGTIDLVASSPPYWITETYDESEGQLGYDKSYVEFMVDMGKSLRECWRVMKDNAFIVWFVADFRHNGVFYDFHGDCVRKMKEIGFTYWDTFIFNSGELSTIFSTYNDEYGRVAKVHEYALIARKVV